MPGIAPDRQPSCLAGSVNPTQLTDRDAVLDAIDDFDEWGAAAVVEQHRLPVGRRYAVEYTLIQYDAVALLARATQHQHGESTDLDRPIDEDLVRDVLVKLEFRLVLRPDARPDPDPGWTLQPGAVVTKTEISQRYGGSIYGGIEPSAKSPNIFIYTNPAVGTLHGYDYDGWDSSADDVFHYTGDGQIGDQQFTGGNKSIAEHFESGRTLRLFEALKEPARKGGKRHRYVGAFRLDQANPWRLETAPGTDGVVRKVIVFRLVLDE